MRPAVLLALALSAGGAQAQTTPAPTRVPPGARSVATLDVIVEDAQRRPIETLTASDFSVIQQDAPLAVESVRFVRAPGLSGAATPTASNDPQPAVGETARLFAIFLDEFHVRPSAGTDRARGALVHFVRNELAPGDLILVHKPMDSLKDLRLTGDREAVVRAIESFEPRRGDYSPRTALERELIASLPPRADASRAQVSASSLEALVTFLGRFSPARKTLVMLSEGFTRDGERRGSAWLPDTRSTVLAANRAHVSIYAIDPEGDRSSAAVDVAASSDRVVQDRREQLRALSLRTGGGLIAVSSPDAFRSVLSDAGGYYVVSIATRTADDDGRFHPVTVNVRKTGLSVRARAGYFGAAADEDSTPLLFSPARSTRMSSSSSLFAAGFARRTSPLIRAWFGQSRGENGATRISFVWEPVPLIPGDRRPAATPARVAVTVTTLDGGPVYDGVVFPATSVRPGSPDPQAMASFEIPPGRLLVRMNIEDVASRVLDRDVRDLIASGFTDAVALGSVEVLRARTAREFDALAQDPDAIPVASRQFSRMERLLVRIPVWAGAAPPALSVRLVSGFGAPMRTLTVAPSASPRAPFQVDLPLAGLPAGGYSLEIVARTSGGEAREDLRFQVTP